MRFRKVLSVIAVAFCMSLGGGAAESPSPEQIRRAVEEAIQQRHPKDTADWWRGLGPQASAVILEMLKETPHRYQRLRLLQALAWFDDPAAREFLKQTADSTDNSVIRGAAVKTYGLASSLSASGPDVEFLEKFAKHSDPQTRIAAGIALRRVARAGSPRAQDAEKALRQFESNESQEWVRKQVREAKLEAPEASAPLTIQKPVSGVLLRVGITDPQAAAVKFEIVTLERKGNTVTGRVKLEGAKTPEEFQGRLEKIGARELVRAKLGGADFRELTWVWGGSRK